MAQRSPRTLICCNATWPAPTAKTNSTAPPPKTLPATATATRTIDTMDSVFTFGCETVGALESIREMSALMCCSSGTVGVTARSTRGKRNTPSRGVGAVHDFVELVPASQRLRDGSEPSTAYRKGGFLKCQKQIPIKGQLRVAAGRGRVPRTRLGVRIVRTRKRLSRGGRARPRTRHHRRRRPRSPKGCRHARVCKCETQTRRTRSGPTERADLAAV